MSATMERPHPMVQDLTERAVLRGGLVADPARHGPLVPGAALAAVVRGAVDSVGIGAFSARCAGDFHPDVIAKWWREAKDGHAVPFAIADTILSKGLADPNAWLDGGELERVYDSLLEPVVGRAA